MIYFGYSTSKYENRLFRERWLCDKILWGKIVKIRFPNVQARTGMSRVMHALWHWHSSSLCLLYVTVLYYSVLRITITDMRV